ncbi:PREDICTED: DNA-directed RNA polymerase V subunit 7-like [Ipomoea nil]|uniref:DNA-directed RNA polymerase V subunit 7-like n=1 Tax=Ipomoea nil TaxID=35883 RepID=UPI000901FDEC|nr:PREDICTED: DNA-directed RNA polymerase V subunit 7-like [Ipomoea nil]
MICECERIRAAAFPIPECGYISTSAVVNRVLRDLRYNNPGEACGYILSVTKVVITGKPRLSSSGKFVFVRVNLRFRSFLPTAGETMAGTVYRVLQHGVFLSFGPLKYIYLHHTKMSNYRYIDDAERPCYQREDLSRIEKNVVVLVKVVAVRWSGFRMDSEGPCFKVVEGPYFKVVVTVDGDSLGPVSLAGDGLDFPCSDLLL